jgi:UDP:flavonoid glycosyltransferase YjiC (YdhE family)
LLPFLDAAVHHGHEVRVAAPPALAEMIQAAGHTCWICDEPPEAEVAAIREQLPVAPPDEASRLGNRELFGRLGTAAMLPGMDRLSADWVPDLLLREPCEYASAVVAHRRGIPVAQIGISLAEVEAGSLRVAEPALRPYGPGLMEALVETVYVSRFPPSLDPSPFPDTVRYRQRSAGDVAGGGVLRDWWVGRTAPLVYVTFGTVIGYLPDAPARFRLALDAVAELDARVLLTVGRHLDPARLGTIPSNVHVEAWVPQVEVMGEANLVVCHGGSGTMLAALAAGVPVVVVPVFGDQFPNGRRAAAAGAGLVVEPERANGSSLVGMPARLTEAITTVLSDPVYGLGAQRLAAEMSGAASVADVLRGLLARAGG